jgi:hypothetical protein
VAFQCRGQDAAWPRRCAACARRAPVIDLAFYPGGAPDLRLGRGVPPQRPGDPLRADRRVPRGLGHAWDRERLSRETLGLLERRGDDVRAHRGLRRRPFEDGPALLHDVAARRRQVIQAVLAC